MGRGTLPGMSNENKLEWERIESSGDGDEGSGTYRAKVPGGWLVQTESWWHDPYGKSVALTFVPDPAHEWLMGDDGTGDTP